VNKKIHIVLSYKNRKTQFLYTLKKLDEFNFLDKSTNRLTVIVVDDGSDDDNRLEDIIDNYNFKITLFRIEPEQKTWENYTCVQYNIGFRLIDGNDDDLVILQNPECVHKGNILKYSLDNVTHKDYLVYSCINLFEKQTQSILTTDTCQLGPDHVGPEGSRGILVGGIDWYVHPKWNPRYFHFCSCMTYKNLKKLNGFDMRFIYGHAFDDDELALRIERLGLNRKIILDPYVCHLYHKRFDPTPDDKKRWSSLFYNRDLFESIKKSDTETYAVNKNTLFGLPDDITTIFSQDWGFDQIPNFELATTKIPKIANFYWGGDKMSFLRYLTLFSFVKYNPEWEVRLYVPRKPSNSTGNDGIHSWKDQVDDKDYLKLLPKEVKIIKADFANSFIGDDAPEAHRSDLLGWQILSTTGGLWCDMDILFCKPVIPIDGSQVFYSHDTFICFDDRTQSIPIGFFFSSPKNQAFKTVLQASKRLYDKNDYQCIGTKAISSVFDSFEDCKRKFPGLNIAAINHDVVYRYDFLNLDKLYKENNFSHILHSQESVGIHWYGGHPLSQEFNNKINIDNYDKLELNTITAAIKYLNIKENE